METSQIHSKPYHVKVSLQKWVGYLYFFFNSVGLKGGLLYTNLLTPFFLVWIYKKGYLKTIFYPFVVLLPFAIIHYLMGVDVKTFLISHVLVLSTIIFVVCAYIYIVYYRSLKELMKGILVFNFILVLIAIPFYFMKEEYQQIFWYTNLFTKHKEFTRLSLLTFEASYYALLLVPIVYYFLFKVGYHPTRRNKGVILCITLIPFLLSMSFGVLGGTVLTAMLMCWFNRNLLVKHRLLFNTIIVLAIILIITTILAFLFFSNSLLVSRISNIFTGTDTSARGRTFESFEIAYLVAKTKNVWVGCGLGQAKLVLPEIIRKQYSHWGTLDVYRIPNAAAETLAIFGFLGLMVRFSIIIYLFIKTRVNKNYLQLSLFLFIFIYQFTGSYITNVVEYVIWIFAFSNVFPEYDKKNLM